MEEMKARIGFARDHARKCLKKHSHSIPVAIEDLLLQQGFTIVKLENISQNISALGDFNEKYIGINAGHSIQRQRFTLAHELGHHLLNHKLGKFSEVASNIDKPSNPVEQEANAFAAELLMPLAQVKHALNTLSLNIDTMAEYFNVSRSAMTYQLMSHKII